jgi:N-acetyl sugar amidotransferase
MDTSDPDLRLDAAGVCRHCRWADRMLPRFQPAPEESERKLKETAELVRRAGNGNDYDSLIGLSGGVDSSFAAHLAHRMGLRPLCVHFDNGWDSELAVGNIQRIVEACGFDLLTYVIDWEEFRDLQRAFLKASVVDIELLTDHAIFAAMLNLAKEHGIRHVLSGSNVATEHGLPAAWVWNKQDWTNIRAIHAAYGSVPLKSFPHLSSARWLLTQLRRDLVVVEPLNLIRYRRDEAARILAEEYGWREYGGKHHESLFTKFYQGYILPTKFGIDKRRAHLSDRIRNGELSREEALATIAEPPYTPAELAREREYVIKKLGFTEAEFAEILSAAPRPHQDFASDHLWMGAVRNLRRAFGRLRASFWGLERRLRGRTAPSRALGGREQL